MRRSKQLGKISAMKYNQGKNLVYFPHFIRHNETCLSIFSGGSHRTNGNESISHNRPLLFVENCGMGIVPPQLSLAEAVAYNQMLGKFLEDTKMVELGCIDDLEFYLLEQGYAKCTYLQSGVYCEALHKGKTRFFIYHESDKSIFTHLWVEKESDVKDWLNNNGLDPFDFYWEENMEK